MTLDEMLKDVAITGGSWRPGLVVSGVTHDSREVRPGDAFVAVRGLKSDGLRFARQAVAAGAAAVVVGRGRAAEAFSLLTPHPRGDAAAGPGPEVSVVEVEDERHALALMSRAAYGRPDLEMPVIGITGTNGKTTTAYLLAAIWEAAGVRCGMIGTVEYRLGGEVLPAGRTTPEAPEIHRCLRRMRDGGAGACVMEVSSHALDLRRVTGIRFAAGVFTNLTRDHLDYHGDMETYFAAKRRLFESLPPDAAAILNADDLYGRRLAAGGAGFRRPILFGESEASAFRLVCADGGMEGMRIRIAAEGAEREIRSPLQGRPNAFNILAASAAARSLGLSWEAIADGVGRVERVPGRLERVEAGQSFAVVVDYAHTDDALRNVLEVLRSLTAGRLLTVFGCGGDRDAGKRPKMGAHAARLSDRVWVTSDNPRSEAPLSIIGMILEGIRGVPGAEARVIVEPDRAAAIAAAVREARGGDTVLIAGKGHETVQILSDRSVPFDDVEVARRQIELRLESERGDAGGEPA